MMILQSQGGQRCKMQALCLAALEIVLEEIEGHLDDGEVEHPDRQIAFTQISDFAQMSRVYSYIWVCSDIWPYSDILLYSDIWVCSDIWLYSDAVGVLIISPTVGGCGLGGLRSNVDSVPQPPTPQQCWLRGRQVHLGHRLGVLASLLVNIALKLHSEESKYTSASPRSTCFPPRATSTQVPLVQGQVHLGCASVNLALDSGDLSGVSGWAPRATSAQVPLVKSTSPHCRTYTKILAVQNFVWIFQIFLDFFYSNSEKNIIFRTRFSRKILLNDYDFWQFSTHPWYMRVCGKLRKH